MPVLGGLACLGKKLHFPQQFLPLPCLILVMLRSDCSSVCIGDRLSAEMSVTGVLFFGGGLSAG